MKTLTLLLALVLSLTKGFAQGEVPQPLTVAVLPFDAAKPDLNAMAQEASILLSASLSTNPELWMVERAEIEKILSEQAISLSGLTDPAKAVQTGKLLGADVLITGRLMVTGGKMICVAKIMSTNTSRVFGELAKGNENSEMDAISDTLSQKVSEFLAKNKSTFVVPAPDPAKWLAALKKQVGDGPLPSVTVNVAEQDLSREVIDPAVETEFKKVLGNLGFEVIDPKWTGKASDIAITGEGISQAGLRHGELVSARARVEIQAVRRSDGKVLFTDRETAAAVDISPATAGKSALQKAAKIILERNIAKLPQR